MSQADFDPALADLLDGYAVAGLSDGFADRVIAATAAPLRAARDRRGLWTHVRRGAIGVLAVGALSAGAVASGLLGAAGIRVPVLTAMLAPDSVVERHKPVVHVAHPAKPALKPPVATRAPQVAASDPVAQTPPSLPPMQQARRERRQAFLAAHPAFAAAVAQGPDARRAFLAGHPGIAQAVHHERRVERRQFLRAHPLVREAMREQVTARRAARAEGLPVPPIDRAQVRERVRELRAERVMGPPTAEAPIVRPLDPERAALREQRIEARRAANSERRQIWRAQRRQRLEGIRPRLR